MKLVIFGVIAFVVGIAGSSGVMVMTSPKLPAGADSLLAAKADSLRRIPAHPAEAGSSVVAPSHEGAVAAAAHGDSVRTDAAHVDSAVPAAHPLQVVATATQGPVVQVVPPKPGVAAAPAGPTAEQQAEAFKQVGSILNNMKPAEAARILEYLSDAQVEGLLRSMGPRPSAVMLGQLPPERAAALSKRLLVPAPKGATP
jgi:hypothetical protein